MIKLGSKKRMRLSGMLANFSQLAFGALIVSNFFKEGNWTMRIAVVMMIFICVISSVVLEPEENFDD